MYKLECVVDCVFETVQVSEKFAKRELWVKIPNEKNDDWSEYASLTATMNNVAMLDNLCKGDKIEVTFVVGSRKFAKKDGTGDSLFNNLKILGVRMLDKIVENTPIAPKANTNLLPADLPADEGDDLPW
jgi:hypothetical protein